MLKKKRLDETEDRIRTNIILSREVFNMAVDYKINLSSFLETSLLNYFAMRQQIFNQGKIQYPTKYTPGAPAQQTKKHVDKTAQYLEKCGRRDLNPSFKLGKLK